MRAVLLAACLLLPTGLTAAERSAAKKIQDRFIAPCCWTQSVAVHDSPIAREMRDEIVRLAAAGKTEEEIVDYDVTRYGERVLRQPRGKAWVWLNAVPIGVLTAGGICVLLFLSRARKPKADQNFTRIPPQAPIGAPGE